MRCPPCHNRMRLADFIDRSAGAIGWQCDRCGYSVNPLAEHNRRFGYAEAKEGTRERVNVREVAGPVLTGAGAGEPLYLIKK